jgi:hypothetical protein
MARASSSLQAAAVALVVTQVVHGFVPADTESEGYVGAVVGLVLLVASLAAVYGLRLGRRWAPRLAGWTGLAVAVGFVAYHATPVRSPVTNPYVGEPVGAPAWISVALAVAAGGWTAVSARNTDGALPHWGHDRDQRAGR